MNEILVENEFTLDRDLFSEGMRRVIRENYTRSVAKLIGVLFLLWLAFAVFALVRGTTLFYALTELVVLLLAAFWALRYVPARKIKKAWKEAEARCGPSIRRSVTAGKTQIEGRNDGSPLFRVSYGEIGQILHTQNLLILIDGQKKGILLKKDSYLRGSEELLLQLIRDTWEAGPPEAISDGGENGAENGE